MSFLIKDDVITLKKYDKNQDNVISNIIEKGFDIEPEHNKINTTRKRKP